MQRRTGLWFSDPKPRGKRWGILRRGGDSDPAHGTWITFDTEEKAQRAKEGADRKLAKGLTIGELREEYLDDLAQRKKRDPQTIEAARNFLRSLLPAEAQPSAIGPACYARMVAKGFADATHQRALRAGRTFCTWLIKQGHLRKNPLTDVEPEGEATEGKEYLTADEATLKWAPVAYQWAADGRDASLALVGCLLLGLRPTEAARGSAVRDLDAGAMLLRVTGKGRKKPRRTYRLDDPSLATYRALLMAAARGRDPDAPLLTGPQRPLTRNALWEEMRLLCKAAGVPHRCPHSLRTTHTIIRLEAGESVTAVSRTIGNSPAILGKHYKGEEAARIIQMRPAVVTGAGQPVTRADSPTEKTG